ncbi:MAG: universal stress protein [Myxococcota bacterium]
MDEQTRKFQTFVVPYDFSVHSREALHMATDLAQRFESEVHLVHVIQPPSLAYAAYAGPGAVVPAPPVDTLELRRIAESALSDVAVEIERDVARVHMHVIESASIPDAIHELAGKVQADLISMGTHGRTGLAHVFLGSVAERVIRRAPCPVLTVQAPPDDEPTSDG